MSESPKFQTFEGAEQLNEHLKSVDMNVLANKYGRREEGLFVFDTLGLDLFVSGLLREIFYGR